MKLQEEGVSGDGGGGYTLHVYGIKVINQVELAEENILMHITHFIL